ncbi:MAG: hypothetical protein WAP03_24275 [Methylorubrum rhodinum]|uniref:hypothetical protein n=1 Tax=Methylorubrum rhodinum TaxID=29428 RepID=UPI003BAFA2E8
MRERRVCTSRRLGRPIALNDLQGPQDRIRGGIGIDTPPVGGDEEGHCLDAVLGGGPTTTLSTSPADPLASSIRATGPSWQSWMNDALRRAAWDLSAA